MTDLIMNFLRHATLNDIMELEQAYSGDFPEKNLLAHMWRIPAAHEYLSPPFVGSTKSEAESDRVRNEGSLNFVKRRYDFSIQLFNESICLAPHPPLLEEDGFYDTTKEGQSAVSQDLSSPEEEETPKPSVPAEKEVPVLPATEEGGDHKGTPEEGQNQLSDEGASDMTDEPKSTTTEPYLALARGYGNRSAVSFHMGNYHACVRDVERALKYSQEKSFRKKLLERKDKCLEAIKKHEIREDIKRAPFPPKLEGSNPTHPTLSKLVRVDNSSGKRGYLVAERDIRPGELLMVEEMHWGTLSTDYRESHCCNCFLFCNTPVPCPDCKLVIFCDEDCRARALAGFHSRECAVLPSLLALDLEQPVVLATRIVLKASYAKLKEIMPQLIREMEEGRRRGGGGGEVEGVFDPSDIRNLILCDPREMKPLSKHYLGYCTSSVMMTKLLEESGKFFVDGEGRVVQPSQDDLRMIGTTVFLITMTIFTLSNSIPYNEKLHGGSLLGRMFSTGIWPTVCLADKSCIPSTTMYFCGSALVMRATLPIPAGQRLTTMRTDSYTKADSTHRRQAHAEGGLQCSCVACLEDWPIYRELQDEIRLKCPKCSCPLTRSAEGRVQCFRHVVSPLRSDSNGISCWAEMRGCIDRILCREQTANVGEDMDEMKDSYAVIDKFLERRSFVRIGEETEQERQLIVEVIEVLNKYAVLPCKLHHDAQELLAACLAIRDRSQR